MESFVQCLILSVVLYALADATQYVRKGSDGREYLIENDQKYNWYQAFHRCQQLNKQLIEINSSQKNSVVTTVLRSLFGENPPNLWLAANDEYSTAKDTKRPFYWSSTGKLMTYSNWYKNNPDNDKGAEHCTLIWRDHSYQWNDAPCTLQLGFICEPNYIDEQKCEELQKKRQNVSGTTAKITEGNRQQQQQQIQNIQGGIKEFTLINEQFDDVLRRAQVQLAKDIQELLAQSVNITIAAVEERNKLMTERGTKMETAAAKTNKEFSDKLDASHKTIDNTLVC